MNALTGYRVSYEVHVRGNWHPSSCGGMDREQADRAAADLTGNPGTYRNVKISNDHASKRDVERVLTTLPNLKAIGDPCESGCDGPCRFGNCATCGGHSEHNWGCREAPGATAMGWR